MKTRCLLVLVLVGLCTGCAAMMMGGNGGYQSTGDCSEKDRRAGLCTPR